MGYAHDDESAYRFCESLSAGFVILSRCENSPREAPVRNEQMRLELRLRRGILHCGSG